jgi:hypothetical protein
MTSKNLKLVTGLATLAGVIAIVVFFNRPALERAKTIAVAAASQKSPATGVTSTARAESVAATNDVKNSNRALQSASFRLRQDFLASRDWRSFALTAMSRPKEGGYFYASYVTGLCSRDVSALRDAANRAVSVSVASKGTVSTNMLQAVDRMVAACASFVPGEATDLHTTVKTTSANGQDPLVVATKAVTTALASGDRDNLRAAVSSLLATGDPLATSDAGILNRVMAANVGSDRKEGHLWFNGKVYGPDDTREYTAVLLASQVATCQQDAPCALDDQLVLACVGGGNCSTDHMEYVRDQIALAGTDAPTFERVASIAQRMRMALASGDVTAFVR